MDLSEADQYFELALDLPERQRAALLERLDRENPELAATVRGLLAGQLCNTDFTCRAAAGPTRDRIHHVALVVGDIRQAVAWYRQRFRCEVAYADDTWAMLAFDGLRVALMTPGHHPPHFAVGRADAAVFGELREHRDGSRYTYLEDPWGNTVEVVDSGSLPGC